MQMDGADYYQRAPGSLGTGSRCCSAGRIGQQQGGVAERSARMPNSRGGIGGADLLCCCCSCSATSSSESPGFLASLVVCMLVFGYTLLGAFAFMALEGGFKTGITASSSTTTTSSSSSSSSSTSSGSLLAKGKIELGQPGDKAGTSNASLVTIIPPGVTSSSLAETTSARTVLSPSLIQPSHDAALGDESSAKQLRAYTVERLWSITEDLNVLYKENWTRLAEREVLEFQEKMAQHGLERARTGSTIYGTAVQRANSHTTRITNDKRLPGVSPLLKQNQRRWTFGSSFLYSITLITTIGYGSISPRTVWGRLITIIYSLAGIPLMLVYLSTIGDVLAINLRKLYGRACGRVNCWRRRSARGACQSATNALPGSAIIGKTSYHRYDNHVDSKISSSSANTTHHQFYSSKSSSSDELGLIRSTGSGIILDCGAETGPAGATFQDGNSGSTGTKKHFHQHHHHFYPCSSQISDQTTVCLVRIPISLCLLIIILYICCGAFMFHRLEGWSLLEGSYFCFTSLGTIGFGDLVPTGGNASTYVLEELSLCACSLYILAGMGLMAMCFNLMQEEVLRVVRVFGRNCGMSPVANCTGARIINNPPPPPPPPSATATSATTGIKSDLSVQVDREYAGPPCTGSILNNDVRLGLGQHVYEDREVDEDDEEAIAMSLVPNS